MFLVLIGIVGLVSGYSFEFPNEISSYYTASRFDVNQDDKEHIRYLKN